MVNGGHIDQGELLYETIKREMIEEWGTVIPPVKSRRPDLLTLTKIKYNPVGRACRYHYDIWYFIEVNKKKFKPNFGLLAKEFFETRWLTPGVAKKIVVDLNTLTAIKFLEEKSFNKVMVK